MTNVSQDLKVVLRRLRRGPGTSLLIVATLGLVLGANTLTFSFVNEIILNPLPAITNKNGLVNVHRWRNEKDGLQLFSYPAYRALAEAEVFRNGLVGFNGRGLSLQGSAGPELVFGMLVSENYFDALGVQPRLGRGFAREDNLFGGAAVVVLSDDLWRTRFGADPTVLGTSVRVNGLSATVVGIGPPRFSGHFVGFAADLWLPLAWAPVVSGQADLMENRSLAWVETFGRLKHEGAPSAEATLTRIAAEEPAVETAPIVPERILVEPLTGIDRDLRMPVAAFLALLQGATLIVAAIALVNVSSLLLARSLERRQETAVRLALGASPKNLLMPFALEAVVLCGFGALLGVALSIAGARVVPGWLPPFAIPVRFSLTLDAATFGFSAAMALMGTLMATLAPGLVAARSQPSLALREGGTQRTTRSRWRSALVITQVAFATTVLVCGSVFARFLAQSAGASPGFDIDRIQITRLDTSVLGMSGATARPLQQRALEAITALPGVERAGFARVAPFSLGTLSTEVRDAMGGAEKPWASADWNAVSTGFFETLGVPLLRGRAFSQFDSAEAPRVVVLSEGLAKRVFGDGDAIGRSLAVGPKDDVAVVVGIAADASMRRLGEEPRTQLYRPFDQAPSPRISILARSANPTGLARSANPTGLAVLIRRSLAQAVPDLPLLESIPLREFASFSQAGARLGSGAGLALGGLGLGLAAVGLFGLLAHTVASRLREIAIRMAMGATSPQILSLVLSEGARLGLTGLGVGLVCALGVSPLVSVLVPGMAAMDPLAFAAAATLVVVVILAATIGPAWRASRVSPAVALRAD